MSIIGRESKRKVVESMNVFYNLYDFVDFWNLVFIIFKVWLYFYGKSNCFVILVICL